MNRVDVVILYLARVVEGIGVDETTEGEKREKEKGTAKNN